jgi:hypothetical protein
MRRTILVAVLVATLSASVLAASARADGDPASDYLLAERIFFPFDAKIPKEKQQELSSVVDAANRGGLKIRVALIWSSYDLGAITALWKKPKQYARFLGEELQYVYKQRLLIVMPSGFGIYWHGHPVDREYRTLAKVPIGTGVDGLVGAASTAVRKLASQERVPLDVRPASASSGNGGQKDRTAVIVLAAIGGIAILVLLRRALRRSA